MTERSRRVVILADTQTHMMPALAREMARRDHDLVLGDAADGLAEELAGMGATVEVARDLLPVDEETVSFGSPAARETVAPHKGW